MFRQYKSILLVHGLQLEPLEVETGKKIGKEIYQSFEFDTYDELLNLIVDKFEKLKLGNIKVSSDKPLILKNNNCHECKKLQYNS